MTLHFLPLRSYCSKHAMLAALDTQYMDGMPELYSNEPRQFHVPVPCHSRFNRSHRCAQPATVVFKVCMHVCVRRGRGEGI